MYAQTPLEDTSRRVASQFTLVRTKAMAQTSAYRVRALSREQLIVERANSCAADEATWVVDPGFDQDEDLQFDDGILLAQVWINGTRQSSANRTTWTHCFNSRGLATQNLRLRLRNSATRDRIDLEFFPGGTVDTRTL